MGFLDKLFGTKSNGPTLKELDQKLNSIIQDTDLENNFETKSFGSHNHQGFSKFHGHGGQTTAHALQKLYMTELWVYAAVNAIASSCGTIGWAAKSKRITNGTTTFEEDSESPLDALINFPNIYVPRSEFLQLIVIDLLTTGNAFVFLDGIKSNQRTFHQPSNLFRINPTLVEVVPDEGGEFISEYVVSHGEGRVHYAHKQILHIRLPNPHSPFWGLSPLIPASRQIFIDQLINENQLGFYKNGARIGGVLKSQKNLTKQQLSSIQRSFESNYTGTRNQHRTLVLPNGMDYDTIQATAVESQLIEFAKYNRDSIISALKVPPIKLGFLEQSSFSNAEIQEKFYFTDTIVPLLQVIEDAFNMHSFITNPDGSQVIEFDLSSVRALREDYKDLAESAKIMMEGGLSVDEVRKLIWEKEPLEEEYKAAAKPKVVAEVEAIQSRQEAAPTINEGETQEKGISLPQSDMARISSDVSDSAATIEEQIANLTSVLMQEGIILETAVQEATRRVLQGIPETAVAPLPQTVQDDNQSQTEPAQAGSPTETSETPAEPLMDSPENQTQTSTDSHIHIVTIADSVLSTSEAIEGPDHRHEVEYKGVLLVSSLPIQQENGAHTHTYDLPSNTDSDGIEETSDEIELGGEPQDESKETPVAIAEEILDEYEPEEEKATEVESLSRFDALSDDKKDAAISKHKKFIDDTDPLIRERKKELDIFFNKYKKLLLKGLKREIKLHKRSYLTKANDDELKKIISLKELDAFIEEWVNQNHDSLNASVDQGFNDTLPDLALDFQLNDPIRNALVQDLTLEQAKFYDETTRKQVNQVLKAEFAKGSSVTQIGQAISRKFSEISAGRADTIARTEVLSAFSEAEQIKINETEKQFSDQKVMKMWITMLDERVRDGQADHRDLHGEEIEGSKSFNDGLSKLDYPRDRKGAAGSIINCRCTLLHTLVDKE